MRLVAAPAVPYPVRGAGPGLTAVRVLAVRARAWDPVTVSVVKRAKGVRWTFGGEEPTGWLPSGAAKPLPTPVVTVTLDLEIVEEGAGSYLLIYQAREDARIGSDCWFPTLGAAVNEARERFGVWREQWERA